VRRGGVEVGGGAPRGDSSSVLFCRVGQRGQKKHFTALVLPARVPPPPATPCHVDARRGRARRRRRCTRPPRFCCADGVVLLPLPLGGPPRHCEDRRLPPVSPPQGLRPRRRHRVRERAERPLEGDRGAHLGPVRGHPLLPPLHSGRPRLRARLWPPRREARRRPARPLPLLRGLLDADRHRRRAGLCRAGGAPYARHQRGRGREPLLPGRRHHGHRRPHLPPLPRGKPPPHRRQRRALRAPLPRRQRRLQRPHAGRRPHGRGGARPRQVHAQRDLLPRLGPVLREPDGDPRDAEARGGRG
jgi:hypothetical protein